MQTYLHSLLPEDQDKIVQQYIKYIKNGIPRAKKRKKVLVIGAGVAGLVSAVMLKDAGHDVTIVEANTRVGGRCKTFLNTKKKKYWADKNLTAEAGAMRLPNFHKMLMTYLDQYQIEKIRFYNASVSKKGNRQFIEDQIEPPHTNRTFIYANYNQVRLQQYLDSTDINKLLDYHLETNKDKTSSNQDENQTAEALLNAAVDPLRQFINMNPKKNWPVVIERFGEYSMRRFLKEQTSYSENAIEMIGVLQNLESRMSYDFIQSFIEMANISPDNEYWQKRPSCIACFLQLG